MTNQNIKESKVWKLGDTSRKYEVGAKGSATTVSSGKGDYGGVSYGLYQFSSKMGTVGRFVLKMKYTNYFKDTIPGTPAFSALWKKAPQVFPNFAEDQHEFIRLTHYQVQLDFLKNKGVDLSSKGPAVQDAIWSTSVQFGPQTSLIYKSLLGKDENQLSDIAIVTAIQDYKINNNNIFFKSSSPAVRSSTLKRAMNEKNDLIALAKQFA